MRARGEEKALPSLSFSFYEAQSLNVKRQGGSGRLGEGYQLGYLVAADEGGANRVKVGGGETPESSEKVSVERLSCWAVVGGVWRGCQRSAEGTKT